MTDPEKEIINAMSGWSPDPVVEEDVVSAERVLQLAATLDLSVDVEVGAALPPLWHCVFFNSWAPTRDLGADGHPAHSHFFPPIPHRRRMFAGGRYCATAALEIGAPVQRRTSIDSVTPKQGKTGLLFFVAQRTEYTQGGELKLVETQDIVYRSDSGANTPFSRTVEALGKSVSPWSAAYQVAEPVLFRFSALTANSHRIHYDQKYASTVEGYPGLVIHGPLLAIFMARLATERASEGRRIAEFSFRLARPAILGDGFRVDGVPAPDARSVGLSVVSGRDTVHATGEAVFA